MPSSVSVLSGSWLVEADYLCGAELYEQATSHQQTTWLHARGEGANSLRAKVVASLVDLRLGHSVSLTDSLALNHQSLYPRVSAVNAGLLEIRVWGSSSAVVETGMASVVEDVKSVDRTYFPGGTPLQEVWTEAKAPEFDPEELSVPKFALITKLVSQGLCDEDEPMIFRAIQEQEIFLVKLEQKILAGLTRQLEDESPDHENSVVSNVEAEVDGSIRATLHHADIAVSQRSAEAIARSLRPSLELEVDGFRVHIGNLGVDSKPFVGDEPVRPPTILTALVGVVSGLAAAMFIAFRRLK